MEHKSISEAASACERFMDAVEDYELRMSKDANFARYAGITGFKETAAVRRASMDLTRALAKMRKP